MFSVQNNPRRAAYDILLRVDEGSFADLVLDAVLRRSTLDPRDRGLVTELVYGILRLRGRIDFALEHFSKQPLKRLQPEVLRLLRLGAYQLLELDRVPAHAAVNSTIELARQLQLEKATGFLNGVLRALERGKGEIPWPEPENLRRYLQQVCSQPVWLSKEVMRLLPNAEARALGEALAQAAPTSLRVNTLKTNREDYLAALAAAGFAARPCRFAPEGIVIERRAAERLPGDDEGLYQIQDEASMLIPHLLDVHPGQKVLDCCAAPGGKTTHIAALTAGGADILALDKYPQRLELLAQGAKRLGCANIETRCWDLTVQPEFLTECRFDRVLLDAPCSGLGVLRRNPEGRWNKSSVDLRELAVIQQTILENVAGLVAPGGKLLYSVCTFSQGETDAVIDDFLADHPEFVLEDLAAASAPEWAPLFTARGTLRSYPHRHDGMDAFFAARLRRRE